MKIGPSARRGKAPQQQEKHAAASMLLISAIESAGADECVCLLLRCHLFSCQNPPVCQRIKLGEGLIQ